MCLEHLAIRMTWTLGMFPLRVTSSDAPGSKHAEAPKRAVAETNFGQIPRETQNISPLCCSSKAVGQWVGLVHCIGHCFQRFRCGFD